MHYLNLILLTLSLSTVTQFVDELYYCREKRVISCFYHSKNHGLISLTLVNWYVG